MPPRIPLYRIASLILALTVLTPGAIAAKNRSPEPQPATSGQPFETYESPFGYHLDLTGSDWTHWPQVSEHVSHPDIGGERWQGAFVSVPACFTDWRPSKEAVRYALLRAIGHEYPTPGARNPQPRRIGQQEAASWERLLPREDELPLRFRYHLVNRGDCSHLFAVWTTLDEAALDTLSEEVIDAVSWSEPNAAADPVAQAWFYNAAGLYFHNAENHLDAVKGFALAARLDPQDKVYINNAASTYNLLNRYQDGLAFMQHPDIQAQSDAMIQGWLGWFEYHLQNYPAAIDHYQRGFALGPLSEDDLYAYVQSLLQQDRADQAQAVLDQHSPRQPGAAAVQAQAEVARARAAYQQALTVLDEADRRGVHSPNLHLTRMDVLGDMRDYEAVIAYSDRLIERGLGSNTVYNYRGDAQYHLERYREAKASFEQALVLQPGDMATAEYLRFTNAQLGKGDSASINTPIEPVDWPTLTPPDEVSGIDGYDSHYPLTVTAYHYDPARPLKTTEVRHIQVHDTAGVNRHSTLMARYNPLSERLYINRLEVFDEDGERVSSLDRSSLYIGDAEDYDQATFGKVVRAPVAGLAPGYRIEFEYTLEQRSPAERFPFERLYLSGQRPIGLSALYIEGELDDLLYNQTNAPQPKKRRNSLLWTVENPTPALWEPMQVDDEDYMASVVVVSKNQWREAGTDYRTRVNEVILADTPELAALVATLTEGLAPDDTGARIAALAGYVQRTLTYKALEFGVRGYTPNPPQQILQDRFGDCKDHSVLLWRLLREAGIPAELALANLSGPVDPNMPSIDQFDHMVVYLPEWNGGTFIDATNKNIDLLGVAPDGLGSTWTLTLGERPALVQVPALDPSRVDIRRSLSALPNGATRVRESLTMSAYFASSLRGYFKDIEPRKRLNWVQRFLGENGRPVIVETLSVDNLDDTDKELILTLDYRVGRSARQRGQAAVIDPAYWERYYLSSHYVHDRQTDFEIAYPLRLTSRITYPVEDERTPEPVADQHDQSRFGHFRSRSLAGADAVTHQFDYRLEAGRFSANDYRDFQAFTLNAIDALSRPVTRSRHSDQATR